MDKEHACTPSTHPSGGVGAPAPRQRVAPASAQDRLGALRRPGLHITLIVALTAAVGFFASFLLWQTGMSAPWLRYPTAIGIGYLACLLLLWSRTKPRAEERLDESLDFLSDRRGDAMRPDARGGVSLPGAPAHPAEQGARGAYDAETLAFVLIAATVLCGAVWAAVSLVTANPTLSVDLLLAIVLALALCCSLYNVESEEWFRTAIRRTVWGVAAVALLGVLLGAAIQSYGPGIAAWGELVRAGPLSAAAP